MWWVYYFIRVDVILGEWDITDEKAAPLVAGYEKLIPHPDFSYNKMDADIGLIKLNKIALFDCKVMTSKGPFTEVEHLF